MRKVILAMQMTLDGFIAGPNEEMDWLIGGPEEWQEMFNDLKTVDTCLLGAKMYPGYVDYWQSALTSATDSPDEVAYARFVEKTPHIVFSTMLPSIASTNIRIARDAKTEISKLKEETGKDIIVWGGATFASALIDLGLIDEYRITLNPNLLGGGKTLFNIKGRNKLKLLNTKPLSTGTIIIRYQSVR